MICSISAAATGPRPFATCLPPAGRGVGDVSGTGARLADPRPATLRWRLDDQGNQTPVVDISGGGQPFLLDRAWYLDPATAELGLLEISIAPALLRGLLNAPAIGHEQVEAVRQALSATFADAGLPLPNEVPHGGMIADKPVPQLRLRQLRTGYSDRDSRLGSAGAELSFRYGDVTVSSRAPHVTTEHLVNGKRYTLRRAAGSERHAATTLRRLGFLPLSKILRWGVPDGLAHALVPQGVDAAETWAEFMLGTVPMLRGKGWEIVVEEDFPHRIIAADGPMDAELREDSGIDWFDLDLGVMVGEERIDLVPPLAEDAGQPTGRRHPRHPARRRQRRQAEVGGAAG